MKKNNWLILLGVLVLHFLLKLFFPDDISLWYNEVMNVLNTQKSWAELLDTNTPQQIQPLYWGILTIWTKIVGFSDQNLRLLSIILSTLTAGSLSFLAIKHFKQNVLLYASMLFLVSGLDLHYSHEVQYYVLSSLLVVWSFYFFFEIWEKQDWKNTILLVVTNTLLLYTHSLTYLVLIIQLIVVLVLSWKQRNILVKVILAQSIALLAFIPWLLKLLSTPYQLIQAATWTDLKIGLVDMAMGLDMLIIYAILFFVIGIGTIFYYVNKKNEVIEQDKLVKTLTLILWVFLPIIASFSIALFLKQSFFFQNILYISLGFVLLVAYLLESLPIPSMYKMIPFAILILVLLTRLSIKDYNHQDIKKAIVESQEILKNNGAIFLQTADIDVLFAYYYDQELLFTNSKNIREKLKNQHIYVGNDATWMKYKELKDYSKILLIQSFEGYTDPKGTLVKKFSEVFKLGPFNNQYLGIRLYEYEPIILTDNSIETIKKELPQIQEEEKVLGMIKVIEEKPDWLQRVILKSKERRISVELMKCLDAIFILKEDYPQFKKYIEKDVLYQVQTIQQNAVWLGEIQLKATEKNINIDVMTFLDALYTLQQDQIIYEQKVKKLIVNKYNFINSDSNWKNDIIKKSKEKGTSVSRMICIDVIYSLHNEDLLFKNYSDEVVLKKVLEIEQNEELKIQLQNNSINLGLDIEIVLFLEAIKVLHQEQNHVNN